MILFFLFKHSIFPFLNKQPNNQQGIDKIEEWNENEELIQKLQEGVLLLFLLLSNNVSDNLIFLLRKKQLEKQD